MNESPLDILKDPKRWTKRVTARDQYGVQVHPRDSTAYRFCLIGAIRRAPIATAEVVVKEEQYSQLLGRVVTALFGLCECDYVYRDNMIADFNDTIATHGDILNIIARFNKLYNAATVP